ncbi:hypothetical protein CEP50_12560 [Actinopolyspora mortivallis]|uniref:LGFP repeat-containing protein n=1 Tax=Actinopolyspora mortivallis TaxID=33906 RepID=A0A2T0GV72_ACTMO|nr:hypothetical protein CEP50_12560 [Actinopolyspora mortivallis]
MQVKNLVGHAVALSTAAALVTAAPAVAEDAEQPDSGKQQTSSTTTPSAPETSAEESATEQESAAEESAPESTESSAESTTEDTAEETSTTEHSPSTTERSSADLGDPLRGPVYGQTPKTPGNPNAERAPRSGATTMQVAPGEGKIQERYESLDQETKDRVGAAQGDEVVVDDSLRYQDYENARFYWTPEYEVTIVFGEVLDKYLNMGGHETLGVPSTDELTTEDGTPYNEFVYRADGVTSAIYAHSEAGTHVLVGPMLEKWRSVGAQDELGYPISDTFITEDERAAFNNFQNNATIFWTVETGGAHVIRDEIRDKWDRIGGARTVGYPTIDQRITPDGKGRYNHFENNASIYWTEQTDAHLVQGLIREKWAATGWERGPMGYPLTDELADKDRIGRFNVFTGVDGNPAGILWSPETGVHTVKGLIGKRYLELGGPGGVLGYPTTDERSTPDGRGRFNHFNGAGGASIYWTPSTGAHEIYGGIRDHWASMGWEKSYLGYPTTGEFDLKDGSGRRNHFEGGHISFYYDSGKIVDQPW